MHPNPDDASEALIASTLARQGIDMGGAAAYNPMHGRTFGAWVTSGDPSVAMRRVNATALASVAAAREHTLLVTSQGSG